MSQPATLQIEGIDFDDLLGSEEDQRELENDAIRLLGELDKQHAAKGIAIITATISIRC